MVSIKIILKLKKSIKSIDFKMSISDDSNSDVGIYQKKFLNFQKKKKNLDIVSSSISQASDKFDNSNFFFFFF